LIDLVQQLLDLAAFGRVDGHGAADLQRRPAERL
jgi:hypothetical protein